MAKYRVTYHYSTRGPDGQVLGWTKGTVVDIDDATAEWVERDCAGLLAPIVEVPEAVEPETPAVVEVPNDVPDAASADVAEDPAPAEEEGEAEAETEADDATAQPERRDRSHRPGRRRH